MSEEAERKRILDWWFRHQPLDHPLVQLLRQAAVERSKQTAPKNRR